MWSFPQKGWGLKIPKSRILMKLDMETSVTSMIVCLCLCPLLVVCSLKSGTLYIVSPALWTLSTYWGIPLLNERLKNISRSKLVYFSSVLKASASFVLFFLRSVLNKNSTHIKIRIPGDPVIRIPYFHCRGHEFDLWSGN